MLALLAERENRPMTHVLVLAMKEYLSKRLNPPEPLKKAIWDRIMKEEQVWLQGYLCRRGHAFWVRSTKPFQPDICLVCRSERNLARTWKGIVSSWLGLPPRAAPPKGGARDQV